MRLLALLSSLLGTWGGGKKAPYLEIALRWKDSMTHWLMSKELILSAYSISNFLPRFNFLENYLVLIYFVCSITQQGIAAQSRVGSSKRSGGGQGYALQLRKGGTVVGGSGFCLKPSLILPPTPSPVPFPASK